MIMFRVFKSKVVALGNLNYQVNNGGFAQWEDNGYRRRTINTIKKILADVSVYYSLPQLEVALKLAVFFHISDVNASDVKYYSLKFIESEMENYLQSLQVKK